MSDVVLVSFVYTKEQLLKAVQKLTSEMRLFYLKRCVYLK